MARGICFFHALGSGLRLEQNGSRVVLDFKRESLVARFRLRRELSGENGHAERL